MQFVWKSLIWVITAIAAWLVYSICIARIIVEENPDKALKLFPGFSEALILQNKNTLKALPESNLAFIKTNASNILKRAPLSDDVFLDLAMVDFAATERFSKPELLRTARVRNARNRKTLRLSLQYHLINADISNALLDLDLLFRLDGRNTFNYRPILDAIYGTPEGQKMVDEKLSHIPIWGPYFLINQIRETDNAVKIRSLKNSVLQYTQAGSDAVGSRDITAAYILKLIDLELYLKAKEAWLNSNPLIEKEDNNGSNIIYNPYFKKWDDLPPFNWQLANNSFITTEPSQNYGLYVSFDAGTPQLVARQIIAVPSGAPLRFSADIEHSIKPTHGTFEWRLACLPEKEPSLTISVKDERSDSQDNVLYPEESCSFVQLELWGVPGLYQRRISMTVSEVTLEARKTD